MRSGRIQCLLIVVGLVGAASSGDSSTAASSSQGLGAPLEGKQRFYIGGWISSPAETMLHKWRPIFEDYLTQEIGPLYNPPIDFKLIPLDYDKSNSRGELIKKGQLDFACECDTTGSHASFF